MGGPAVFFCLSSSLTDPPDWECGPVFSLSLTPSQTTANSHVKLLIPVDDIRPESASARPSFAARGDLYDCYSPPLGFCGQVLSTGIWGRSRAQRCLGASPLCQSVKQGSQLVRLAFTSMAAVRASCVIVQRAAGVGNTPLAADVGSAGVHSSLWLAATRRGS